MMSVGLAIFLSALVIALVFLYKITSDKWDWSQGLRRFIKGGLILISLVIVLGLGLFIYNKIDNRPSKQNEYADLRFDMTMAEVKYAKGSPTYVLGTESDEFGGLPVIELEDLKEGQKVEDFKSWGFKYLYGPRIDVDFDRLDKVKQISCYSRELRACPPLLGLYDGSSEAEMYEKLGDPTKEHLDSASLVKKSEYKTLNVSFYLKQKKIYMMVVTNNSNKENTP